MNYKNIIKKQSFVITASVLVMALILLGTSYALFTNKNDSDTQVVSSGSLVVSYTGSTVATIGGKDGSGNQLEIEPMDEETVNSLAPFTIKVKNTGTLALKYNIFIYTDPTNTLPHSFYSVKYKLGDSYTNKTLLSSLPKADPTITNMNDIKYKLTSEPFVLEPGHETTHEIYLWVDEDVANITVANMIANAKILVEGTATDASPAPQYSIVSGNLDTVGSIVKIADEEFYVIGQEDPNHVKLLSKWNLNVGSNSNGTASGKQDSSVRGYRSDGFTKYGNVIYSISNYWYDASNNKAKDDFGGFEYNNDDNKYIDSSNNVVVPYVYNNSKDGGVYNTSIAQYIDNYVQYLNTRGVNVSGRLISKEEIESIINNGNSINFGNLTSNASNLLGREWIYSTSYWSGSASEKDKILAISIDSDFSSQPHDSGANFGVRPVIILQK